MMLQVYESIFLSKLLFNSQSWSRIKKKERTRGLATRPIKDVKASHQSAVYNTCSWYFPRTRLLPIEHLINQRKLTFLHHILNLDEKDPVFCAYKEQQEFINEPNWSNEITTIRQMYSLNYKDSKLKLSAKLNGEILLRKASETMPTKNSKA